MNGTHTTSQLIPSVYIKNIYKTCRFCQCCKETDKMPQENCTVYLTFYSPWFLFLKFAKYGAFKSMFVVLWKK